MRGDLFLIEQNHPASVISSGQSGACKVVNRPYDSTYNLKIKIKPVKTSVI